MEKDHRLFLRNLPLDIDNDKLKHLFEEHGNVTNIDIKEKVQNDGTRIAFVNLTTSDRQLNTCFRALSGKDLGGNALSLEVAKESFLDRLKREREEAAKRKEPTQQPKVAPDHHIERINIKAPPNLKTKPTKRIYNFDDSVNDESTEDLAQGSLNQPDFSYDPALQLEEEKPVKKETVPSKKVEKEEIVHEPEFRKPEPPEKKIICESEAKRLASLKQKRQQFRLKEQMISHALKAVDGAKNRKIIFSDDIDNTSSRETKKSQALFDDNDEEDDWSEEKFQHDEKRSAKLKMSMSNSGRDQRFNLDERFLDDEQVPRSKDTETNNEDDLKNETNWQLGILQNVLGKPLKTREERRDTQKRNKMVRYDPTASDHRVHELETKSKATQPKRAKKAKNAENAEPEEEAPVVSSDVFYSVSDNLTDALKGQEEFSLLKAFGTASTTERSGNDEYSTTNISVQKSWEREVGGRNPFKYESSDEEGPDPMDDEPSRGDNDLAKNKTSKPSMDRSDSFFFAIGDQRFRDAEAFFKTRSSDTENFSSVRRQLKMIVRKKVHNNRRKNTPWQNKKISRTPKVR